MKKSILALLLALAMLMALAGCGSSGAVAASSAAESASQAASGEEEAAPAAAAPAAEAESSDAEPQEAVDLTAAEAAFTIEYPLVDEPTTLTYWQAWPPFLNEISSPGDASMFEKMEEITGIHLDITAVSTENDANDFMLRCASGDLTDMIQKGASHYTGGGAKAIEDDILIDMLPLLEENMPDYWAIINSDNNIYKNVVNDEGQVPSLIGMYKDYYYTDQGYWIRQDILDEVGKEIPTTVDELDDVLSAFKDKGLTDGLVVLSEGNCDLLAKAYGADNRLVDGVVEYRGISDNYKEFLKKMNDFYNKGYINIDFVTYTDSDTKPPQDVVLSDNAGIFNEDVASIAGYYLMATNPSFELAPLPQIRVNAGDSLDNGFVGVRAADKYSLSISTQCENPELCLQYMNYLFTEDGFVLSNYGIEGETYTVENGEYQFTDLILNNESGFDWQLCQSLYINPGFPCLNDLSVQELTYNEAQKAAVPAWVGAFDSADETMPNTQWLSYTTEESYTIADLQSDLETVQDEFRLKAITGQVDIDAEWDNYVAQCESMGLYELQEIDQAAVDRYLAK